MMLRLGDDVFGAVLEGGGAGVMLRSVATRVAPLAVIAALLTPAVGFGAMSVPARCPKGTTIDLAAPSRAFAPIHRVPQSGVVPFGPGQLRMESMGAVFAGGGLGGFRLFAEGPSQHSYKLGWTVTLDVVRLDVRGSEEGIAYTRRFDLEKPVKLGHEPVEVAAPVASRPAFYRLDLSIRGSGSRLLGAYSEYLRVVSPTLRSRLVLSAKSFRPGDIVAARLENNGTKDLVVEPGLKLEHHFKMGWMPVGGPEWLPPVAIEASLPGGEVWGCERFKLPADLAPGLYRLSKAVSVGSREIGTYAYFRVS